MFLSCDNSFKLLFDLVNVVYICLFFTICRVKCFYMYFYKIFDEFYVILKFVSVDLRLKTIPNIFLCVIFIAYESGVTR